MPKKIMGVAIAVISGLLATILGAVAWVVVYPEIAINNKTFTWAVKKFGPEDYPVAWSSIEVEARSESLFKKSFSFRFGKLCASEKANHAFKACFDRMGIDFKADLTGFKPRISVLGPIEIEGGDIVADLDRMPKNPDEKDESGKKKESSSSSAFELPTFLQAALLKPVEFDVPRLKVATGGKLVEGALHFKGDLHPDGLAFIGLKVEGKVSEPKIKSPAQDFRVFLELKNPRGMVLDPGWTLEGRIKAVLPSSPQPPIDLDVIAKATIEDETQFNIDARYHQGRKRADVTLRGHADRQSLHVTLTGEADRPVDLVENLKISHCELNVKLGETTHYGVSCPLNASVPFPPSSLSAFEIPARLGLFVGVDLSSSTMIPSAESQLEGSATLAFDPILAPLFTGGGRVKAHIDGKLSQLYQKEVVEAETHIFAKIPHFEKLVERLSGTQWDVPAPLRALKGSFEADASGKTDLHTGFFPSRLDTHLVSESQALKINAESSFEFKHAVGAGTSDTIDAKVVLSDVQVELPRLDLAVPPRFTPDDRIKDFKKEAQRKAEEKKKAADKKATKLAYQAEITTPDGHPLRVLSNLATAPIPIELNLSLDSHGGMTGPIKIDQFPVVLFRQKATIDHFTIVLSDPRDASTVDGLIKIPHGDYTILIYIVGTVAKPRVRVESDPPVPANQLLSVLLYGESQDDLNANQNASVGSTQAALSAGAMGLASLYLFASTPIQSVLYDPTTGQVTARVSLGGGTTLDLGSNGSQLSSVGVRKSLGRSWSVSTAVDPSKENPGSQVVTGFLEWIHRY